MGVQNAGIAESFSDKLILDYSDNLRVSRAGFPRDVLPVGTTVEHGCYP